MKRIDILIAKNKRYLKNCLRNLFIWEGLPESIYEPFLNDSLLFRGAVVGCKYKKDVVVLNGALSGLDIYYRPIQFTSANPSVVPSITRKVGKDCVICYNTSNYEQFENCNTIVDVYAYRLAQIELSVEVSTKNSRVCNIVNVGDDREAIRTSKILEKMYDGEASVLSYKTAFGNDGVTIYPIKARDNIVVSELADARRNVMADFWSEIGVKTVAVDKKERTNLEEMSGNSQQLKISADIMLKPREVWADEMNKLFNTNISVKLNDEIVKEDVSDVSLSE